MDMKKIVAAVAMAMVGSAYAADKAASVSDPATAKDQTAQAQTQPTHGGTSATAARDTSATSASNAGDTKVRELQQRLKDQGHDPGPIDGIMGPRTQAALDASQQGQAKSSSFGPKPTDASPTQSSSDASAQPKN